MHLKELIDLATELEFDETIDKKMNYKPGDTVPTSGIYDVLHDERHPSHQVTAIEGKRFPPSNLCDHPRYVLKVAADHLHDHPDYDHSKYA